MKLQSLNNGYVIRPVSPKPNCSAELKLPATVRSCAPEQDLRVQSVAIVGLGKSGRAAARLAIARGASVFAFDQNPNLRLLELAAPLETLGRAAAELQIKKRIAIGLDLQFEWEEVDQNLTFN